MNKLTRPLLVTIAALGLAFTGCKKKEEAAPAPGTASATAPGTASATAPGTASATAADPGTAPATGADPGTAAVPADTADYLRLKADHVDAAKGPVDVVFSKWTVKAAKFDPANLEGGTAEIEVNAAELSSGVVKRDDHLRTPDFLDVAKFPLATVKVANVKKTGDKSYTADATINVHGVEKVWNIKFDVVSSTADSVQIKFAQPFSRADFGVGPKETDNIKLDVTLEGQLTIKNT